MQVHQKYYWGSAEKCNHLLCILILPHSTIPLEFWLHVCRFTLKEAWLASLQSDAGWEMYMPRRSSVS